MRNFIINAVSATTLFLLTGLLCSGTINRSGDGWVISTGKSVCMIGVKDGRAFPVWYGSKDAAPTSWKQDRNRGNGPYLLDEVPVRGHYADKLPLVEAVFPDGVRDIELSLYSEEVINVGGHETLRLTFRDKAYPLEISSFIRPLPDEDIMEKWIEVRNISDKKKYRINLDNILSGSVLLPNDRYFLTHHSGQWFGEFSMRRTELTTGVKSLMSRDFYSFENTPWFCIGNEENPSPDNGDTWFGQIEWSGNWRLDFHQTNSGALQIAGGINFWDSELALDPGETFSTPRLVVGYCNDGEEGAMRRSHSYVRKYVQRHKNVERPVIYNSWYATYFNISEKQQIDLARVAKEIGVEVFVIDDGWFKGRKSDNAGLGDWTVDREKFPNGLAPLISEVHSLGMKFGLWVEPEMVNPDSDLYRKHPDWALNFPNRERTEWRHQLTLNLAREDVCEYILESMTSILSENDIDFIKWDRNRGLTQPGWTGSEDQKAVRIKYMQNLHRIFDTLESRFPDVIFENCASGAGRPGLDMVRRSDQTWASDNTDPVERLFIQYGYLGAWPANTMVCWTSDSDRHKTGVDLGFSFDVAMQGVVGIGQDITKWSPERRKLAADKIALYKALRNTIQNGTAYRLLSPYNGKRTALQYVAGDGAESVVFCYNLAASPEGVFQSDELFGTLELKGLDPDSSYSVLGYGTRTGKELMERGLKWPLWGAYKSRIIIITQNK
ncbi:MAG: alpha-galactosidase [Candidatus Cryptobacteroides sp.]